MRLGRPVSCLASSLALAVLVPACATGIDPGATGDDGDRVGLPDSGVTLFPDSGQPLPDAAPPGDAPPPPPDVSPLGGDVTLTQSNSMVVAEGNTLACTDTEFHTYEASYYRRFDLPALGITGPLEISQISFGIEVAQAASGGSQPASVKLHTLDGTFVVANLTELASAELDVEDQTQTVLTVPITATVPAGATLIAEFAIPDGTVDGNILFPGTNAEGQTAPTYVRDACPGFEEPADTATFEGGENMHFVLAVEGSW